MLHQKRASSNNHNNNHNFDFKKNKKKTRRSNYTYQLAPFHLSPLNNHNARRKEVF